MTKPTLSLIPPPDFGGPTQHRVQIPSYDKPVTPLWHQISTAVNLEGSVGNDTISAAPFGLNCSVGQYITTDTAGQFVCVTLTKDTSLIENFDLLQKEIDVLAIGLIATMLGLALMARYIKENA
jgi:hypothetical protein